MNGDAQPCGCTNREDHLDPILDVELLIGHGERSELCGDPPPYEVPGSSQVINGWLVTGDAYCLCGHPNYLTCLAWGEGHGVYGLTLAPAAVAE